MDGSHTRDMWTDFVIGYAAFGVGIAVTNVIRVVRGCGMERIELIACYLDLLRTNKRLLIHGSSTAISIIQGYAKNPLSMPAEVAFRHSAGQGSFPRRQGKLQQLVLVRCVLST